MHIYVHVQILTAYDYRNSVNANLKQYTGNERILRISPIKRVKYWHLRKLATQSI